ncbi:hypothetical protein, partial [Salmonella enterica]|uniref:hypothetical protein n=1 Tax=Salmonella enterica TaxID=28901 RepID=UPI001C59F4A4
MQRLSLLARGTPKIVAPVEMVWRFIPADAGNTVELYAVATVGAGYSPWRGGHLRPPKTNMGHRGLSPLARG